MPSRVPSRWIAGLLVLISLATPWLAAWTATPPPSRPTKPGPRPSSQQVGQPRGRPLPDSVLALVGDKRMVTTTVFRRSWGLIGAASRPDSLTPKGIREFLDLLVDKELLAERASQETWEWTSLESAQVKNVQDRATMRVALDQAMARAAEERAARGDPPLKPEALGIVARESTVARLEVTYDETLLASLAKSWAALPKPSTDSTLWARLRVMGQMPVIEPGDSARVVAWSKVGTLKVADLLEAWKKLNPLFRPRVETPEQVRDLVKNGLFERVLRREAEQGHFDRHPNVEHAVRNQKELLASQYLVSRDVYGKVPTDEATLRRYYDRDPKVWAVPTRLRIVRMVLPDRAEASAMAVRLRNQAEADTIVERGMRQKVNYMSEISAASDSALFAAALASGTGTVLGPDSLAGGWQVVRVSAVLPAYGRSFEEVRELVLRAWSEQESERRMRELLADVRKRTKVVVNENGLERMLETGIPVTTSSGKAP